MTVFFKLKIEKNRLFLQIKQLYFGNMSQPTMVEDTYYLILHVFYVIFDTEEKVLEKSYSLTLLLTFLYM